MVILIMKSIQKQKGKTLVKLAILAVSVLLVYSASAYYFSLWPFNSTSDDNVNKAGISTVDDANDDAKEPVQPSELEEVTNGDNSNPEGNTGKKLEAHVGVAFASVVGNNLEVRAFTTSEIKGDATCTAIATSGSETVTGTSKSFIDATSSQCHPILIPITKLKDKSETWSVSVKYESNKYSGQSPSYEVSLNEGQ